MRDGLVKRHAQPVHRLEIGQHRVAKPGQVRPEVDAAKRLARQYARVVGGKVETDIERLLAVHLVARVVEVLGPLGGPAAVSAALADVERRLGGGGQAEKRVRRGKGRVDQLRAACHGPVSRKNPVSRRGAPQIGDEPVAVAARRKAGPVENGDHAGTFLGAGPRPISLSAARVTRSRCRAREASVELSIR